MPWRRIGKVESISFYFGTSWRWVVSFMPRSLYPQEGAAGTHRIAGLVDSKDGLYPLGKRHLFPISGIEGRLLCLQFVAWSLYWPNCLRFWKLKESYVEIALAVDVFGVQRENFVPNRRWKNFTKLSLYLHSYMEINFECDLLCLKDITACTRLSWPSREWWPLSVNLFLTSVSRPIVWTVLSSSFSHSV